MTLEKDIIGNTKIVRYLDKVLQKGFVSHAYLFEGPEHVGKMTVALAFAGKLLGDVSEDISRNPDLILVSPDKEEKQIGVEAARRLQKDLSLYPFKASYKVAIIEKAETLSPSAANSLLKTIEEPGETSIIILVASDMERVLPTIRSRCQILSFTPVTDREIADMLEGSGTGAQAVVDLAEGRPGLALRLRGDKELQGKMEDDRKTVLSLFGKGNYARMESISRVYEMEKEEVAEVLGGWIVALRAEMLEDMAHPEAGGIKLCRMKAALERTIVSREDILEKNVNPRLALENLVLGF